MTVYYVLKYGEKYYAPYQSLDAFNKSYLNPSVDTILTDDRTLAIRFGDLKLAKMIQSEELLVRRSDLTFDPKLCRIFKVTHNSKKPNKNAN